MADDGLDLRPGMRVLDLGCGRAASSIFLRREFGVQRWATDHADGWQRWLDWHRAIAPDNAAEILALEADRGRYLGYVRLVGRRQRQARLDDLGVSLPSRYTKQPLLRSEES